MKRNRKVAVVASAAIAVALASAAVALARFGNAETPEQSLQQVPPKSTFSLGEARVYADHPLYYAGESVDGLPLAAVLRDQAAAGDVVSFIYGDCVVVADTGCAPPAEVQVWPACMRSLALYDTSLPGTVPVRTTLRGVPAAFLDEGRQLEIHTGSSLVVVFADSQDRLGRIASALRGVNVTISPKAPLPAPAPGAVEGELRC